ncbi:MAG: PhoH family protein [Leptolyngbyaceae bacterium]|nr:PhoH family protein [Leptolyngbyaceae bacterium]
MALTIDLLSPENAIALSGENSKNLSHLSDLTGATLTLRGQDVYVSGTESAQAQCEQLINALRPLWSSAQPVDSADIQAARHALNTKQEENLELLHSDSIAVSRKGLKIRAKTFRQKRYVNAIKSHDLTFCIGPAGTGKTFLAAIVAVQALLKNEVERLILTRPAVEAGEKLGFLPGDLQQKVNPYLRPLYDAIYEVLDAEKIPTYLERGIIEVAPLAYMRGRTLNDAFIILDEAQNTTSAQMKMMLTRLGSRSRMVVTGDVTQTDLPRYQESGLAMAEKILKNVKGIAFCELTKSDVVRHPLVQRIVEAYEQSGH